MDSGAWLQAWVSPWGACVYRPRVSSCTHLLVCSLSKRFISVCTVGALSHGKDIKVRRCLVGSIHFSKSGAPALQQTDKDLGLCRALASLRVDWQSLVFQNIPELSLCPGTMGICRQPWVLGAGSWSPKRGSALQTLEHICLSNHQGKRGEMGNKNVSRRPHTHNPTAG